jgi:hypothetical protein
VRRRRLTWAAKLQPAPKRVIPRGFSRAAETTAGSPAVPHLLGNLSRKPEPTAHQNHLFSLFPATATTDRGRVPSLDYPHVAANGRRLLAAQHRVRGGRSARVPATAAGLVNFRLSIRVWPSGVEPPPVSRRSAGSPMSGRAPRSVVAVAGKSEKRWLRSTAGPGLRLRSRAGAAPPGLPAVVSTAREKTPWNYSSGRGASKSTALRSARALGSRILRLGSRPVRDLAARLRASCCYRR